MAERQATWSSSPGRKLYRELGLYSVREAGRDAWLIIFARSNRMFAYGANSTFIALFFSALGFSDARIGLFMTLTLAGDVLLTLCLTTVADRVGRRRTLLLGSGLMVASGIAFVLSDNYWVLLLAAIFGVISPSGGDFGPFRAIEESMISELALSQDRSNVLSWYVTTASFGSAIGTEVAGHLLEVLVSLWTTSESAITRTKVQAYHAVFGLYIVFGLVNMACSALLSKRTELPLSGRSQPEEEEILLDEANASPSDNRQTEARSPAKSGRLGHLSAQTRSVLFKLWPLLIIDSLADGMVGLSLTTYYIDQKFGVSASTLGHIVSISYFLAAVSTIFAGPLANRIGLVSTMVFTHVPSSAAVLLFPLPSSLIMTIILFYVRTGLNNMDQAPRSAFIAAVVPDNERTAVNGITSMLRTLAATLGPSFTGGVAESGRFWIAFVAAGICRLAYDFGLWALFINMVVDTR